MPKVCFGPMGQVHQLPAIVFDCMRMLFKCCTIFSSYSLSLCNWETVKNQLGFNP